MKKQINLSSSSGKAIEKTLGELTNTVADLLQKGVAVDIRISPQATKRPLYPEDKIPDWLKK